MCTATTDVDGVCQPSTISSLFVSGACHSLPVLNKRFESGGVSAVGAQFFENVDGSRMLYWDQNCEVASKPAASSLGPRIGFDSSRSHGMDNDGKSNIAVRVAVVQQAILLWSWTW